MLFQAVNSTGYSLIRKTLEIALDFFAEPFKNLRMSLKNLKLRAHRSALECKNLASFNNRFVMKFVGGLFFGENSTFVGTVMQQIITAN